jgi:hypothetical protein
MTSTPLLIMTAQQLHTYLLNDDLREAIIGLTLMLRQLKALLVVEYSFHLQDFYMLMCRFRRDLHSIWLQRTM